MMLDEKALLAAWREQIGPPKEKPEPRFLRLPDVRRWLPSQTTKKWLRRNAWPIIVCISCGKRCRKKADAIYCSHACRNREYWRRKKGASCPAPSVAPSPLFYRTSTHLMHVASRLL
jgi:hypothetical protein